VGSSRLHDVHLAQIAEQARTGEISNKPESPRLRAGNGVTEPASYRPVFLYRDCGVALRSEPFEKNFSMRPWPSPSSARSSLEFLAIVICLSFRSEERHD
jgi:hypothetical protein